MLPLLVVFGESMFPDVIFGSGFSFRGIWGNEFFRKTSIAWTCLTAIVCCVWSLVVALHRHHQFVESATTSIFCLRVCTQIVPISFGPGGFCADCWFMNAVFGVEG